MKSLALKYIFLLFPAFCFAGTVKVRDMEALSNATKNAKPGDTIILQNGNWSNVNMQFDCNGSKNNPIVIKAENAGKALITGTSKLSIGGSFIVINGLYFTKEYAGSDPVIKFSIGKNKIANNCRLTNTVINDFNNPKRLDENYWIALYGKHNRIDHCSFLNKKNLGVLMAVVLEDESSRENFDSIDHNYFGERLPLASNAGEIIRVGVSQQAEFNSNTQIVDNFFEHCDGETEIISLKSCSNVVRNNLFKECQGSVVLRHGNYNTVAGNIFLGNNKAGTGGVRVINKGHIVNANLFYQCRGEGFRSPLSVMNGVPNSPANRYVPVRDVDITYNVFYECSPIDLCDGSDSERSVPPQDVSIYSNFFYNTKDSLIYNVHDSISGIEFSHNLVSKNVGQQLTHGFRKINFSEGKNKTSSNPILKSKNKYTQHNSLAEQMKVWYAEAFKVPDSRDNAGYLSEILPLENIGTGAEWFASISKKATQKTKTVSCKNALEILAQLEKNEKQHVVINLTNTSYSFEEPLMLRGNVTFTSNHKNPIKFSLANQHSFFIQLTAGYSIQLKNLRLDLTALNTTAFISTDTSGSSNHSNLKLSNCHISNYNGTMIYAAKSSVADSMVINNCSFKNGSGTLFSFAEETGKKGYYNVEHLRIRNNIISNHSGQILTMIRSGNDESTMGPFLIFSKNKLFNCYTTDTLKSLLSLSGIQKTIMEANTFSLCNEGKTLLEYKDEVRATHRLGQNTFDKSGAIKTDKFVNTANQ